MRFVTQLAQTGRCRRGTMMDFAHHSAQVVETPACTMYTRGGSVPHLTPDIWEKLKHLPTMVQMPMPLLAEHSEAILKYKEGLESFTSMQGSVIVSTVQDSATEVPPGYNDKMSVAVWGKGGKCRLEADHYMDIQEAFQPDVYQALSDGDTNQTTTRKRLRKSVDRTLQFLDLCIERHQKSKMLQNAAIFGVVEGGYDIQERLRSARETSARPVQGFSIEGFHNLGPRTENFRFEEIKDVLQKTLAVLPADRPRLMLGSWRPDSVLAAVSLGIDIFDSSYPYIITEKGEAEVFDCKYNNIMSGETTETEVKKRPQSEAGFTINLKDSRYNEDFRPLLQSCQCYCCQNFTRSYIHHLLNTKELLASVLLMIHNFHHYFEFFHMIRQAIEEDKFQNLVQIIQDQAPARDS